MGAEKMIENKGRLFGKINIIDFLIVASIIGCLWVGIPVLKALMRANGPVIRERIEQDIRAKIGSEVRNDIRQEVASRLSEIQDSRDNITELEKSQLIWYDGFRAGFAEGYSAKK
jgi:hypothetical protein